MSKSSMADKVLSPKALNALKALGANIVKARFRRDIRQKDLAKRAGMSHVRLRKLEKGDPTVGLGALAQVLDILDLINDLPTVAHPDADSYGKALEDFTSATRVSATKQNKIADLDF